MPLVIYLFFSTQGRITRTTWWIGIAGLVVWNVVVFLVLWSVLGPSLVVNFLLHAKSMAPESLN